MAVPLAMGWRHLLFENYRVDPNLVERKLPACLNVDTFDGHAWLSIVPFTNVHVRPYPLPGVFGIELPELNLRTYVEHDGEPGVYFFSLDADGLLSVIGARLFHHLPYFYASISLRETDGRVAFESRRRHPGARPAAYRAVYEPLGDEFFARERGLPRFLFERYRLFTEDPQHRLRETVVDHDPWAVQRSQATVETNTLLSAMGFAGVNGPPVYFYSRGVDVVASRSRRRCWT